MFQYHCLNPIAEKGLGLFDEEYKKKAQKAFFEKYPACREKKIILFAPTFRGNLRKEAYYPMKRFPLDSFLEHISKEYMVIIKHHPFIREKHPVPEKYQTECWIFLRNRN